QEYSYLNGLGGDPNSEKARWLKGEADKAELEAERLKREKMRVLETARRRPQAADLIKQLEQTEIDLRKTQEREQIARKLLEDSRKELSEIPPEPKQAAEKGPLVDPARTDLLTHDAIYQRLTLQAIGLDLELKSPSRVQPVQAASTPSLKDTKKQILA